jgi:hypothetical protein
VVQAELSECHLSTDCSIAVPHSKKSLLRAFELKQEEGDLGLVLAEIPANKADPLPHQGNSNKLREATQVRSRAPRVTDRPAAKDKTLPRTPGAFIRY